MKAKRNLVTLMLCVMLSLTGLAAAAAVSNAKEVPQAIQKFIEGLNNKSYSTAAPFISKEFNMEGVPEEYIKQALTQVFGSFPIKIDSYLYKQQRQDKMGTVYTVSLMVHNQVRDVEFGLDKSGKVLNCSMFAAQTPQAMNEAAKDNLKLVPYAETEFELVSGLIILPATLNGEPVKFLLDSGAPVLVLNAQQDSAQSKSVIGLAQGVGGSINNMGYKRVESFDWAGGSNSYFDAITMDLSHLEQETGIKFAGLISKAELEPFETYIDYAAKKIRFYQLNENGSPVEADKLPQPSSEAKFTLSGHIACLKATIGKHKVLLGLDTGAQTNLLENTLYPGLESTLTAVQTDTLSGADTNQTVISTGVIPLTKLGKQSFPEMRYAFSDISELNKAYHMEINGLLGYPFLSQKPVSINYRKQVLRFY